MESGIDPGQDFYTQDYYNYDHGWVCIHHGLTPKRVYKHAHFHPTLHEPRRLNTRAQTEVLMDKYLEYTRSSFDKPASVYPGIKKHVALSQTQRTAAGIFFNYNSQANYSPSRVQWDSSIWCLAEEETEETKIKSNAMN